MAKQANPRSVITFAESEGKAAARIKMIGVGGAGGNAVNRMIRESVAGVEFIVCDTELQALSNSHASVKIQLGRDWTGGLGSGGDPEVGKAGALADLDGLRKALGGAQMVFVTAGLGGGTGTGAAPIVAGVAKELGALTIAVVSRPFDFEGLQRARNADRALKAFRGYVDSVVTLPNEQLLRSNATRVPLHDAFAMADEILTRAVRCISDIILLPGLVNVDFEEVRAVLKGSGVAMMGVGMSTGHNRVREAVQRAISSDLLEEASIEGAKSLLVNLTGGPGLTLTEVNDAMMLIRDAADREASLVFGVMTDQSLSDEIRITLIATNLAIEEGSSESVHGMAALKSRPYTLDDLRAKFNTLLARMQTPEARNGMKAAFDLSSAELGRAATDASRGAVEAPLDITSTTKRRA